MKRVALAALIATTLIPAKAQLFSNDALGGAIVGGIAGGLIGGDARGMGIGAGAGLLLGAATASYRDPYYRGPYASGYYAPARPNYALGGAVVGGVAGGLIGHGTGHNTVKGVAIGAGAGLLLGGLAEHEMRKREQLIAYSQPVYYTVAATPATVLTTTPTLSQPVSVQEDAASTVNPAPAPVSSPMSGANALFGR